LRKKRIFGNLTHYALFSHTRERFKEKRGRKHKGVLRYKEKKKEKKKKSKEGRRAEGKTPSLNSSA